MQNVIARKITASSFVEAHGTLGMRVRDKVWSFLTKKLDLMTQDELVSQIRFVRTCRAYTEKILLPTAQEYLACLGAWVSGTNLSNFIRHSKTLGGLKVDGQLISAMDVGWLLQDDNRGCQTGMCRQQDGSVIFWHTEEDHGGLTTTPLIVKFKIGGEEISTFVYPHLLPGPAFNWRAGMFQACVALHIGGVKEGALGNMVCWLAWRLGQVIKVANNSTVFSPSSVDGYAINIVERTSGGISGNRLEFGGDAMIASTLSEKNASWLFQVALVSDPESRLARKYERVDSHPKDALRRRFSRTEWYLRLCRFLGAEVAPDTILHLLKSRRGGDWAYANWSVLAYVVGRMSREKMDLWVGLGPADKNPPSHLALGHRD